MSFRAYTPLTIPVINSGEVTAPPPPEDDGGDHTPHESCCTCTEPWLPANSQRNVCEACGFKVSDVVLSTLKSPAVVRLPTPLKEPPHSDTFSGSSVSQSSNIRFGGETSRSSSWSSLGAGTGVTQDTSSVWQQLKASKATKQSLLPPAVAAAAMRKPPTQRFSRPVDAGVQGDRRFAAAQVSNYVARFEKAYPRRASPQRIIPQSVCTVQLTCGPPAMGKHAPHAAARDPGLFVLGHPESFTADRPVDYRKEMRKFPPSEGGQKLEPEFPVAAPVAGVVGAASSLTRQGAQQGRRSPSPLSPSPSALERVAAATAFSSTAAATAEWSTANATSAASEVRSAEARSAEARSVESLGSSSFNGSTRSGSTSSRPSSTGRASTHVASAQAAAAAAVLAAAGVETGSPPPLIHPGVAMSGTQTRVATTSGGKTRIVKDPLVTRRFFWKAPFDQASSPTQSPLSADSVAALVAMQKQQKEADAAAVAADDNDEVSPFTAAEQGPLSRAMSPVTGAGQRVARVASPPRQRTPVVNYVPQPIDPGPFLATSEVGRDSRSRGSSSSRHRGRRSSVGPEPTDGRVVSGYYEMAKAIDHRLQTAVNNASSAPASASASRWSSSSRPRFYSFGGCENAGGSAAGSQLSPQSGRQTPWGAGGFADVGLESLTLSSATSYRLPEEDGGLWGSRAGRTRYSQSSVNPSTAFRTRAAVTPSSGYGRTPKPPAKQMNLWPTGLAREEWLPQPTVTTVPNRKYGP